ncbi:hypothetical protein Pla52n_53670 [Stieleria varia]|uniref:Uncharacterized protein n=1 Tax=Stieleria varia TaxID=2528005 RepID=A0A5C6A539_9BACT|nr:hypothetical protein Pla52n_53670 [Stieleria varia]
MLCMTKCVPPDLTLGVLDSGNALVECPLSPNVFATLSLATVGLSRENIGGEGSHFFVWFVLGVDEIGFRRSCCA